MDHNFKTENSSCHSTQGIPWQSTFICAVLNIKKEVLAAKEAPGMIPQMTQKDLTKEAFCMICVMLSFVLLAVFGSIVTAYEFFFDDNVKNNKSPSNRYEENRADTLIRLVKGNKSPEIYVWLENIKSFLKFFCIVGNGRRILSNIYLEDQMDCIQGLRFFGNAWLIFYHTAPCYFNLLKDIEQMKPFLEIRASQLLLNGHFSTDMFFVISGFLNAYLFLQNYNKRNGNISWVFFYFKRFVRLTPVYMIVLGCYSTLFTYSGSGIMWPTFDTNPVCRKVWLWHLLYINNFEETTKQCMMWCWQLAADMQFYMISPLFMISLMRWPRFGYFLVFSCIAASCGASFMLTYSFNLIAGTSRFRFYLADVQSFNLKYVEFSDILYGKPYTRLCSYLVGFILGYFLNKKFNKKDFRRNNKVTLCCGWGAAAIFMWICFFSLHDREEITSMEQALYNGIHFFSFSCGIAWIIYVCLTGQAGYLNKCLSWKVLNCLGRLSYCAYLIHPIILKRALLQVDDVVDFSVISLISLYLYICAFTYLLAFILSLLYEVPVLNILDRFSKKKEKNTSNWTDSTRSSNSQKNLDIYKIS